MLDLAEHFRTRTPKGDGNSDISVIAPVLNIISEHEPRKGTETSFQERLLHILAGFQNTNPERGRKLAPRRELRRLLVGISEHEPRKGTETKICFF